MHIALFVTVIVLWIKVDLKLRLFTCGMRHLNLTKNGKAYGASMGANANANVNGNAEGK